MSETLIQIDNIRISRRDKFNLVIERLETNLNNKTKEPVTSWNFVGYYSTLYQALSALVEKEYLINEKSISDIKDYLRQVEKSNSKVLEVLEGLKGE